MAGMPWEDFQTDVAPEQEAGPWSDFAPVAEEKPSGILRRGVGDVAVSALKGAISLPEAAVGLADIPTLGLVGKSVKAMGVDFKGAREELDTWLSPEQQQLNREVQETEGFLPTLGAMVKRPSTIAHQVIESAPSMIGGGAIGRGLLKIAPKIGAVVGGAMGEGAVSAGQTTEQARQMTESGLLTPGQAATGAISGALTGLIGILGGKLAKRLNVADAETLMAGGSLNAAVKDVDIATKKNILRKVIESAIMEGAIEELPQSAQEQISQNIMLGKPPAEGVGEQAAMGLLTGGVMGGGAGVGGHIMSKIKPNPVVETLKSDPLNQSIEQKMAEVVKANPEMKAVNEFTLTPAPISGQVAAVGETPITPVNVNQAELGLEPTPVSTPEPPLAVPTAEVAAQPIAEVGQEEKIVPEGNVGEVGAVETAIKQPWEMTWDESRTSKINVTDYEDSISSALDKGEKISDRVVSSLPAGLKARLFPESVGNAPWQKTASKFENEYLLHGTNLPKGKGISYVEPRIGEFTRQMYSGAGEGTFEEMGGKPLAYFSSPKDAKHIEQYAEGVAVYPKKGEPYILVTDKPSDLLMVKEDGLYDADDNLISRDTGIGPETGDIISEEGAAVIYKIPLAKWRQSGAKTIHEYFVKQALSEGKPVPPEVLADYPDLQKPAEVGKVAEVTPTETEVKQPWEMNKDEFAQWKFDRIDKLINKRGLTATETEKKSSLKYIKQFSESERRKVVLKAIQEGKNVPESVIKSLGISSTTPRNSAEPKAKIAEGKATPPAMAAEMGKPVEGGVENGQSETNRERGGISEQNAVVDVRDTGLGNGAVAETQETLGRDSGRVPGDQAETTGRGETKSGLINDIKSTLNGVSTSILRVWETKLEEFKNGLQRTIRENRVGKTSPDTVDNRQNEVLLLGRLRDQRRVDERIKRAIRDKDEHWDGVRYSPEFADTPEFGLAKQHFGNLGYDVVPISEVKWGGCVDIDDAGVKTVFLGTMSGWRFAYFMSHETSHILSSQGNEAITVLKKAIDLSHPFAVKQREGFVWTDDYARDEFVASIIGGMTKNEAMLKGNQTTNIKTAREASTSEGKPTGNIKTGPSYGFVQPRPPAFYSKLSQIIQNASFTKMPVPQLRAFLKGKQVTDAEIDNIVGTLTGTVTKQQVLDEIKVNGTEFKDVVLGQRDRHPSLEYADQAAEKYGKDTDKWPEDVWAEYVRLSKEPRPADALPTHFSQYVEPGAVPGSYREMFVTTPGDLDTRGLKGPKEVIKQYLEGMLTSKEATDRGMSGQISNSWQDGHSQYSDITNPIARIRYNERNVDGKRILFVEEIQGPSEANQEKMPEYLKKRIYDIGVKRVLALVKEQGFDGVAWTPGEMQAARYDLSKHLDTVAVVGDIGINGQPIGYTVKGYKDGNQVITQNASDEKGLADLIGKELAGKITSDATERFKEKRSFYKEYSGLDLKVGGEGLKSLYDRTLPAMFKKYGKEGVGETTIPTGRELMGKETGEYEVFSMTGGTEKILGTFPTNQEARTFAHALPNNEWAIRGKQDTLKTVPFIPITPNTPASYTMYGDVAPSATSPATNQPSTWKSLADSRKANIFHSMFDRFVDLDESFGNIKEWLNSQGTILTDDQDPLLHVRQYPKIKADQERRFMESEVNPAFDNAKNLGVSLNELQTYMHNFIAEKTNATLAQRHIAKIDEENLTRKKPLPYDPSFQDGKSGIKTQDALNYLSSLTPEQVKKYEAAAKPFWDMGKKNRDIAISYQLESPKTMALWEKDNPFYLPLYRDMGKESNVYEGIGQGFTNVGGISKGRVGSEREVVNPIANLIMQRAKIISRGEKNKTDIAMANLVKMAPNPDWWKPATVRIRKVLSANGEMIKAVDPTYKYEPNVIMSRQLDPKTGDIIERGVEFNKSNPRAERLANALKNADMDKLGLILDASSKITRFISKANTEWSPTFGPTNFLRDWGFMLANLSTTPLKGKQVAVSKKMPFALSAIYSEMRARRSGKKSTNPLSQAFDDFQKYGGMQGYSDMFRSSDQMANEIENKLSPGTYRIFGKRREIRRGMVVAERMFQWLSDFNKTLENATRFSVYQVAVENGMTKPRAANLANEITVDFSKKGQIATQAGALFAFFNASAQGSLNVYKVLTGPSSGKIIMGGILFGAVQSALLSAWGFGDDEPPDFIKERNIIIPTGEKSYKTIPLPLGLNILPNIGRVLAEATMAGLDGKPINPMSRIAKMVSIFADSFNPLGGSGISVQSFIPTPVDPLVALAENLDWNRQQISRPDFSSLKPTPGFTRAKDTASYTGKGLSWALNMLTGGTEDNKGFFSPTPDQIDYLAGQFTGGLGREITKAQHIARAISKDEEIPAYRIPLISRFHGSTEGQAQESTRFYNNIKKMNMHENEIKGRRDRRESVAEYMKENPEARFFIMANKAEGGIRKLQKRKRELKERDASQEMIKTIDTIIANRMKKFNDTILRAEG